MPGIQFRSGIPGPSPIVAQKLAAKSTTVKQGDFVCLSTLAALTTSGNQVVRSLLAADIAALYQDGGGNTCGILGISNFGWVSDSSGVTNGVVGTTGVSTSVVPVYQIPNYAAGNPVDPTVGFSQIQVIVADQTNVFKGNLGGAGTVISVPNLAGTKAGIAISSGVYTVDTSVATKILNIVGINNMDSAKLEVFFNVQVSFDQNTALFPYTAQ